MPNTAFFQPDLFTFLRQLKRHNDREWFAKNKVRYQQVVVDPAMQFISGFAPHLAKLSSHLVADARPTRGSLFRIYKDTRFFSDKTPYKTHIGITSPTRSARTPTRPCSISIWNRKAASRRRESGTRIAEPSPRSGRPSSLNRSSGRRRPASWNSKARA